MTRTEKNCPPPTLYCPLRILSDQLLTSCRWSPKGWVWGTWSFFPNWIRSFWFSIGEARLMSCILPTLRKYHNVKLYCISYQFRVDYFDGKKFPLFVLYSLCFAVLCGFSWKKKPVVDGKRRMWMERGE